MQAYYAARATEYDDVYSKPERQSDLRSIQEWLPSHFFYATVLEVACGTGYWTQFIARTAARIVAIDTSLETIEIARRRVTTGNATFVAGDAYALPLGAGAFNAAFAGFWFSHVPKAKRQEFLRGLHSRLAPGAPVILIDNLYVDGSSTPIAETDTDGNTYQTRHLRDGSIHRVLKNFPSEPELRSCLGELGTMCTFRASTYFWAFTYAASTRAP
jgi:demethylmenaquinone methyltransferase/2-methoxy-6-polyprenyl-1,4-benzoquinol methylase